MLPKNIIPKHVIQYLVNLLISTDLIKRTKNLDSVVSAILWRYYQGSTWRALADLKFLKTSWMNVFKCFNTWSKKGVFQKMFIEFLESRSDIDLEVVYIDSTGVNIDLSAFGAVGSNSKDEAIGKRTKGGFKTKIHLVTDAHGNPLRMILTEGTKSDVTVAAELLAQVIDLPVEKASGDKGYDSENLREFIRTTLDAEPVIPRRRNSKTKDENFDKSTYKGRHLIENRFNSMKKWRGIATRYDKTKRNYESAVHIVMLIDWLKLVLPVNNKQCKSICI